MKHAPTITRHRTIDPERTRRHMLRDIPDHLILPIPTTGDEQDEHVTRFHTWVRNWTTAHKVSGDPIITTFDIDRHRRFEIRAQP